MEQMEFNNYIEKIRLSICQELKKLKKNPHAPPKKGDSTYSNFFKLKFLHRILCKILQADIKYWLIFYIEFQIR